MPSLAAASTITPSTQSPPPTTTLTTHSVDLSQSQTGSVCVGVHFEGSRDEGQEGDRGVSVVDVVGTGGHSCPQVSLGGPRNGLKTSHAVSQSRDKKCILLQGFDST